MKVITITLATETERYAEDIEKFLELMLFKLKKNAHKGRWENINVWDAMDLLMGEVEELTSAINTHNSEDVFFEAADVANYAMIIASIMRERHGATG